MKKILFCLNHVSKTCFFEYCFCFPTKLLSIDYRAMYYGLHYGFRIMGNSGQKLITLYFIFKIDEIDVLQEFRNFQVCKT